MGRRLLAIKPSTRAFLEEARSLSRFSLFDLIHGYVYLRWPYLYISIAMGEYPLSKPDPDRGEPLDIVALQEQFGI